jgi:hypothetical protein
MRADTGSYPPPASASVSPKFPLMSL